MIPPPYPFYKDMILTNYDNSHIPIPGFYSKTVPSFGLVGGGSNCEKKCVKDCEDNCGSYCKIASNDRDVHNANVKELKEINAKLKTQVDRLSYDFLRSHKLKSRHTPSYHTPYTQIPSSYRQIPSYRDYTSRRLRPNVNINLGGYKKSKKRNLRRKTRKGGLSIWGSTTDLKPCDTSCKRECPYQCKTICNRAVNDTLSDGEKNELQKLHSENQNLRNAITMYS